LFRFGNTALRNRISLKADDDQACSSLNGVKSNCLREHGLEDQAFSLRMRQRSRTVGL
jgi:hypothetical protein